MKNIPRFRPARIRYRGRQEKRSRSTTAPRAVARHRVPTSHSLGAPLRSTSTRSSDIPRHPRPSLRASPSGGATMTCLHRWDTLRATLLESSLEYSNDFLGIASQLFAGWHAPWCDRRQSSQSVTGADSILKRYSELTAFKGNGPGTFESHQGRSHRFNLSSRSDHQGHQFDARKS